MTDEHWHKLDMKVSWTDSGKMLISHPLADGRRITYGIEISPELARQITDGAGLSEPF